MLLQRFISAICLSSDIRSFLLPPESHNNKPRRRRLRPSSCAWQAHFLFSGGTKGGRPGNRKWASCLSQEVCLSCDCGSAAMPLESKTPARTRRSAVSLDCSRLKSRQMRLSSRGRASEKIWRVNVGSAVAMVTDVTHIQHRVDFQRCFSGN